jgi:ribose transport system substrate-binding protein
VQNLKIAVCLITRDNDYQREQADSAESVARKLGVKLQILYGEGDSITQSQLLLELIQSPSLRPDGIVCETAGTGLSQVAQAAAAANVGWAILNHDVDYLGQLRSRYKVPVFSVSTDNEEVGRIQARQLAALCPTGGTALFLQGPSMSTAAQHRLNGFNQTKPANLQTRAVRAQWTEESAYAAVQSWLRLSTSHQVPICAVVAQNDSMAVGARRAFEETTSGLEREQLLSIPFLGCDGVPSTGQSWVRSGLLTATVITPPNTGVGLEMLVDALRSGKQAPEQTMTVVKSFPEVERLVARKARTEPQRTASQPGIAGSSATML